MNTSGLLKKLLSSNADDVASRLSSKYIDDAARAVQSLDDYLMSNNPGKRLVFHKTDANVDDLLKGFKSRENTGEAFVSSMASSPNTGGYGRKIVPAYVDESKLRLDDMFPNGEEHFGVKAKDFTEAANDYIKQIGDYDNMVKSVNTLPSREQIMNDVLNAVDNGTIDDVYRAAADMPVLARTANAKPVPGGEYSPVGVQRLRDLNELNFGYGGGQREQMLLDPEMLNQGRLSGVSKNLDDIGDVPQIAAFDELSRKYRGQGRSLPDLQEEALREVIPEGYHTPINSREDLQRAIYGNALGDLDTHHYAELNANIRPQDIASFRSLPRAGMPKDNTFLDDIAQRLYDTKGDSKATKKLLNRYMLSAAGIIPTAGILGSLFGGDDTGYMA